VRTVFAYPGNMADAQNNARAMMEAGVLDAFVTTFVYRRDGWLAASLKRLPRSLGDRVGRQLARRAIDQVDARLVHAYPMWELARTAAMRVARGPIAADLAWDYLSHRFDRLIARRYVPRTESIHAYEYTALDAFRRAKVEGVARVLYLPSFDSRRFEEILRRERGEWPELASPHDAYFDAKFERRYARRREEIELADVIVTNSALTAKSHIEAGAEPSKFLSVPLAAPAPIDDVRRPRDGQKAPLVAMWAGPFSLRKGAHYLLDAWQLLNPGSAARLDVFGTIAVPERVRAKGGDGVVFHGSVPQSDLFRAYEAADVLVFPTLSDGFGMVVAEAMAHGLPVITTNQAGAACLITPDNGVLVPAGDARALAEALQWCLDNRVRLAEMRHHALETARRRQWADYRRELIAELDVGLRRAGYTPNFGLLT
jgi:glycosyltransferase involved in cell wall biosynthesis